MAEFRSALSALASQSSAFITDAQACSVCSVKLSFASPLPFTLAACLRLQVEDLVRYLDKGDGMLNYKEFLSGLSIVDVSVNRPVSEVPA